MRFAVLESNTPLYEVKNNIIMKTKGMHIDISGIFALSDKKYTFKLSTYYKLKSGNYWVKTHENGKEIIHVYGG